MTNTMWMVKFVEVVGKTTLPIAQSRALFMAVGLEKYLVLKSTKKMHTTEGIHPFALFIPDKVNIMVAFGKEVYGIDFKKLAPSSR